MSALLKLVPGWGWALLAGLALAGAQQIRVINLQDDLVTARKELVDESEKLGACRATRTNLLEQIIEQNGALARLRAAEQERANRARDIQQQAEGEALHHDQQALAVMQERTPTGADACAAASKAFDDELKRERGL